MSFNCEKCVDLKNRSGYMFATCPDCVNKLYAEVKALREALLGFYDGECRCSDSNPPCVQCVAKKALELVEGRVP